MNVQSNSYTFIYASVMVILVAAGLSIAAISLQPMQEENVRNEKMQNILASIKIQVERDNAQASYDTYIKSSFVIDSEGNKLEGADAFEVKMEEEVRKDISERKLPVYVGTLDDGSELFIVPLRGKGLWGPIWGYMSFKGDYNTIYGAVFDHKSETPGLGAEINKDFFQDQFEGKTIFDSADFVSINVHKGGPGAAANAGDTKHGVDGISGGTITSNGLQDMLKDCLKGYVDYFKQQKASK